MIDCLFARNSAIHFGGSINDFFGTTLTARDITFAGNSATNQGGGIDDLGAAGVGGSTFTGDTPGYGIGGLKKEPGGLLTPFDNPFIDDQDLDVIP